MKIAAKLWIGLIILALLSPIGLILPNYFKAGTAWGEWSPDEIKKLAGYVPQGLEKLAGIWNAPIPDYGTSSIAYIFSAIVGIAVTVLLVMLIGKILANK